MTADPRTHGPAVTELPCTGLSFHCWQVLLGHVHRRTSAAAAVEQFATSPTLPAHWSTTRT
ncbi:hypothetical protein PV723_39235 [Streptomyces sp. AK04-3B]|nr:hypothetical protein [Streptomyces sp. AK04-3B]MDX3804655.1 hypothetical protein [Streptomyces sp. AK04-3B]